MRTPIIEGGDLKHVEHSTVAGTKQVLVKQQLTLIEGFLPPCQALPQVVIHWSNVILSVLRVVPMITRLYG